MQLQSKATRTPFKRTTLGQIGDIILIALLVVICFLLDDSVIADVHKQAVPDVAIFERPDVEETISTVSLVSCSTLPWWILFVLDLIMFRCYDPSFKFSKWLKQFYIMNKMVFFSGAITVIITDSIKYFVGYPRPYFITANNEFEEGLVDESFLNEARLSFVSGHSSISMNSLLLLSLMMHSSYKYTQNIYYNQSIGVKMTNSDNPHDYYLSFVWYFIREIPILSIIIIFIPTIAAIYIGLTRIVDYKHFPVDVISGMLVGACCSLIAYSLFWNETYFDVAISVKKKYDGIDMEATANEISEAEHLNEP